MSLQINIRLYCTSLVLLLLLLPTSARFALLDFGLAVRLLHCAAFVVCRRVMRPRLVREYNI
jgi:hypothetical protein